MESSRIIYEQLIRKLSQPTKYSCEAIKTAASLLFYTITTLKKCAPDREVRALVLELSKGLTCNVHKDMVRWIQRVYGNTFGSPVGMAILLCADEELEVGR